MGPCVMSPGPQLRGHLLGRPLPRCPHNLEHLREETGGSWYRRQETGQEGWLCPALLRYFPEAPRTLYVQVKPA